MRAVKLLKYPKKPKKSASLAVKERYLMRVKDVEKENLRRLREFEALKKREAKINGLISSKTTHPTKFTTTVLQKYSRKTAYKRNY